MFRIKDPIKEQIRRKKISETLKKQLQNPVRKKKISEASKKRWQNPEFRKKVIKKIKEKVKKAYANPEIRKKISMARKGKSYPHKGIPRSPETRKKISERLKRKGIKPPSRKGTHLSEKHKKILRERWKGEKNPNWQGGKSFEEYPEQFWQMRKAIRERDDYTCQLCGKYPAFEVHHIDYNKKNNEPENLITLCKSCHIKTNKNREYWKNCLQKLIKNKKYERNRNSHSNFVGTFGLSQLLLPKENKRDGSSKKSDCSNSNRRENSF